MNLTPGAVDDANDASAESWAPGMLLSLALGWLLVTLGIWGACGRPWWVWPLAVGLGFLGLGALLWWIEDRRVAAVARTLTITSATPGARPA